MSKMSKSSIIIQEGYWKDGKLHGRGRRIEYYGDYYPCLHFEFRSGGKSSSPPYELSFGGDELWTISDARSPSMLG